MKSISKLAALTLTSALSFPSISAADEYSSQGYHDSLKFLLGTGLTIGGDELVKAYYTDGSKERLNAGEFIDFKLGFSYQAADSNLRIQTTVGYFFDDISGDNFDASFTRIPVEVLFFHAASEHQFGFGGTYHTSTNLDVSGLGLSTDVDFDNSLGLVAEYAYDFGDDIMMSVRYVDIEYTAEGGSGSVDGSHFGIYGTFLF